MLWDDKFGMHFCVNITTLDNSVRSRTRAEVVIKIKVDFLVGFSSLAALFLLVCYRTGFRHEVLGKEFSVLFGSILDERKPAWWDGRVNGVVPAAEWKANFRMGQENFCKLCDELRPYIERQTMRMRAPIDVERQVAATLYYLSDEEPRGI